MEATVGRNPHETLSTFWSLRASFPAQHGDKGRPCLCCLRPPWPGLGDTAVAHCSLDIGLGSAETRLVKRTSPNLGQQRVSSGPELECSSGERNVVSLVHTESWEARMPLGLLPVATASLQFKHNSEWRGWRDGLQRLRGDHVS